MTAANFYLLAAIAAMAVMTFVTRAAPFLLLGRAADKALVRHLGNYLPPAVMLLLVIYSVRAIDPVTRPYGLHQMAGIAVTALCHLRWRQPLVSIGSGTGVFMLLERFSSLG